MARMQLEIRLRWWVQPYLALTGLFMWTVVPFLGAEHEGVQNLIESVSTFIGRHGVKLVKRRC